MESNQNFICDFESAKAARTTAYSPQAKLSPLHPTSPLDIALDSVLPAPGNDSKYELLKNAVYTPQAKLSPAQFPSSITLAYDPRSPTPAFSTVNSFYDASCKIEKKEQKQEAEKDVCSSSYKLVHSNNFLSQPLFASPNPSFLSEAGTPLGCSQRTQYLDPEEFFERHCTQKNIGSPSRTPDHLFPKNGELPPFSSLLGNLEVAQADYPALASRALNIVSLAIDGDNLENDVLFTFDISESPEDLDNDVPGLQEEQEEASGLIRESITPCKRAKFPDKLEAMQSMAKRRAATLKAKLPPRKDKTKMKPYNTIDVDHSNDIPSKIQEGNNNIESSNAFGSVRISEALGWCKCKYSRCLKVRDAFVRKLCLDTPL